MVVGNNFCLVDVFEKAWLVPKFASYSLLVAMAMLPLSRTFCRYILLHVLSAVQLGIFTAVWSEEAARKLRKLPSNTLKAHHQIRKSVLLLVSSVANAGSISLFAV